MAELVLVEVSTIRKCTSYLPHGLPCGFDFTIALGILCCGCDVCETPPYGKFTAVIEELSSLVSNCECEQNYLRREWVDQERQQVETWRMRHSRRKW